MPTQIEVEKAMRYLVGLDVEGGGMFGYMVKYESMMHNITELGNKKGDMKPFCLKFIGP